MVEVEPLDKLEGGSADQLTLCVLSTGWGNPLLPPMRGRFLAIQNSFAFASAPESCFLLFSQLRW